jgi:hypothetical protein
MLSLLMNVRALLAPERPMRLTTHGADWGQDDAHRVVVLQLQARHWPRLHIAVGL